MVIEDINVENIEGKLKLTVSLCEKIVNKNCNIKQWDFKIKLTYRLTHPSLSLGPLALVGLSPRAVTVVTVRNQISALVKSNTFSDRR